MTNLIRLIRKSLVLFFTVFTLSFALNATASNSVLIKQPYSLALPPIAKNGAVYLQLENISNQEITLLSASSDITKKIELHNTLHTNGVIRMQRVNEIKIRAKSNLNMHPNGGLHIMLMHLKKPLVAGESFPLTLNFSKNTSVSIDVIVKKPESIGTY